MDTDFTGSIKNAKKKLPIYFASHMDIHGIASKLWWSITSYFMYLPRTVEHINIKSPRKMFVLFLFITFFWKKILKTTGINSDFYKLSGDIVDG